MLGGAVIRGKGLLWIDETERRYIFHLVGKRFSRDEDDRFGTKKNKLVLIGRCLDKQRLLAQLAACLAPAASHEDLR